MKGVALIAHLRFATLTVADRKLAIDIIIEKQLGRRPGATRASH